MAECANSCLPNRSPRSSPDLPHLIRSGAIGGHEHNDIANGPCQHTASGHGLAHTDARALPHVEGLAGAPVFHQLDAGDEPHLADVADLRQAPKSLQFLAKTVLKCAP